MRSYARCAHILKRLQILLSRSGKRFHVMMSSWVSYVKTGCVWKVRVCRDDVIRWKHFPRYWPFVRGIHRSLVNSLHTGQWRGALMFSLICAWMYGWANNGDAGDLRRHLAHYDVIIMSHKNPAPIPERILIRIQIQRKIRLHVNPFRGTGCPLLILIPACINDYILRKGRDEITYPFPNFSGASVEVLEWIINSSSHFIGHLITNPRRD